MTYLQQVENLLDLPPAEEAEVLRELESHLEDIRAELVGSGTDPLEAATEAERRMGPPDDVALRLNAAHNTASWKSTILTTLPFLAAFVLLILPLSQTDRIWPVSVVFLITAFASIRELVRGRRPIWLSSWLAAALISAVTIINRAVEISGLPADAAEFNAGIISGLGIVVLACIAAFAMRRWRWFTSILMLICLSCAYFIWRAGSRDATPAVAVGVLGIAAYMAICILARGMFQLHPYGNGLRASFFLLCILAIGNHLDLEGNLYQRTIILAITAGMAIIIARARTRYLKVIAVKVGLLCIAPSGLFSLTGADTFIEVAAALVQIGLNYCFLYLLILWPLWLEVDKKPDVSSLTTE